jgi:hypothetical protein
MAFPENLKVRLRKKAFHQCCLCFKMPIDIHHIVPQEQGGPDTEDNAAPLCPTCHRIYGNNVDHRKMIREARDNWYEKCSKRFAEDAEQFRVLAERMENNENNTKILFSMMELLKQQLARPEQSRYLDVTANCAAIASISMGPIFPLPAHGSAICPYCGMANDVGILRQTKKCGGCQNPVP